MVGASDNDTHLDRRRRTLGIPSGSLGHYRRWRLAQPGLDPCLTKALHGESLPKSPVLPHRCILKYFDR
jgi:hypothetical protein